MLVVDLYQLLPVNARQICTFSLEFEHLTSYIVKNFSELFKAVELDVLNKAQVGDLDSNRKGLADICKKWVNASSHNFMLNKFPDDLLLTHVINNISTNSGFTQC